MIRFTAFITCSAAFALAVPNAVSAAVPVAPSQSTRPPSATMSTLAVRAKISASLSKTSFEASEVRSVKLSYGFSKRSKHFRYRLSVKNGASWQTVNMVKKTGRFKGSHTVTVKKFFAGEPVKVGSYRLRLTADGGGTTLAFTVISPPGTPSEPPAQVKPQAGYWKSTILSGPVSGGGLTVTSLRFTVLVDQATVAGLGFGYDFSFGGCSSGGYSSNGSSSAITSGEFTLGYGFTGPWTGAGVGRLVGSFDSPTSAHGTGSMEAFMFCTGLGNVRGSTGTFSWTATPQ